MDVYWFSADRESPGRDEVTDRRIPLTVANKSCHETDLGLIGSDVRLSVTVLPEFEYTGSVPLAQPPQAVASALPAVPQSLPGDGR